MNSQITAYKELNRQTPVSRRRAQRERRHRSLRSLALFLAAIAITAVFLYLALRPSDAGTEPNAGQGLISSSAQEPSDAEMLESILGSSAYPDALKELAEKNSETLGFVYHYPEFKDKAWESDLSGDASCGSVPLLMQWDYRWGYKQYGEGLVGYTGCGPTCLSMVALYLTGNEAWDPGAVSDFAVENGYCVPGSGSSWTLISEGCSELGMTARELPLSQSVMESTLSEGTPIILALGAGDFSDFGHFIVLTGFTDEGFTVNDPNSRENSAKAWSYNTLSPQIRNIWAMDRA